MKSKNNWFEPEYQEIPVPDMPIPDNWLDQLVEACAAAGLECNKHELKTELKEKVGILVQELGVEELRLKLQELYKRLKSDAPALSKDEKMSIALKIKEGASECYGGFFNRILMTCASFKVLKTLPALLTAIRVNIVTVDATKALQADRSVAMHVHMINRYFAVASTQYGVKALNRHDTFSGISDEAIRQSLQQAFEQYDSPIYVLSELFELIKSNLKEHYHYYGKSSSYDAQNFKEWTDYLEPILGQEVGFKDCIIQYPHTDEEGKCALIQVAVSPLGKSISELKAMLKGKSGFIFYKDTLYTTDYSNQNAPLLKQYKFEADESESEKLAVLNEFTKLPIDTIYHPSDEEHDQLLNNLDIYAINGKQVDLNWSVIKSKLFNMLSANNKFYMAEPIKSCLQKFIQIDGTQPLDETAFSEIFFHNYIKDFETLNRLFTINEKISVGHKLKLVNLFLNYNDCDFFEKLKVLSITKAETEVDKLQLSQAFETFVQGFRQELESKKSSSLGLEKLINCFHLIQSNSELYKKWNDFLNTAPDCEAILNKINPKLYVLWPLIKGLDDVKKMGLLRKSYISSYIGTSEKYKVIARIFNTLPQSDQYNVLTWLNAQNDNLLMNLIFYAPDSSELTKMVEVIASLENKRAVYEVLRAQNSADQKNALLYAFHKNTCVLPLLNILEQLNPTEQQVLLNLTEANGLSILDKAAVSPLEIRMKITKLINKLTPLEIREQQLVKWFKNLSGNPVTRHLTDLLSIVLSSYPENGERLFQVFFKEPTLKNFLTDSSFLSWLQQWSTQHSIKISYLNNIDLFNLKVFPLQTQRALIALVSNLPNNNLFTCLTKVDKKGNNLLIHYCSDENLIKILLNSIRELSEAEKRGILTQKNSLNLDIRDYARIHFNKDLLEHMNSLVPGLCDKDINILEGLNSDRTLAGMVNALPEVNAAILPGIEREKHLLPEIEPSVKGILPRERSAGKVLPPTEISSGILPQDLETDSYYIKKLEQDSLKNNFDIELFKKIISLPITRQNTLLKNSIGKDGLSFVSLNYPEHLKKIILHMRNLPFKQQVDLFSAAGINSKMNHKNNIFSLSPLEYYEIQLAYQFSLLKKKNIEFSRRPDSTPAFNASFGLCKELENSFNIYQTDKNAPKLQQNIQKSMRKYSLELAKHRGAGIILEVIARILLYSTLIGIAYFIYKRHQQPDFSLVKTASIKQMDELEHSVASLVRG